MANEILVTLSANQLDLKNLLFRSYDFVNNMSGQFNDTQQKIQKQLGVKFHTFLVRCKESIHLLSIHTI